MTIEVDCITCFVKQAERIIKKFVPEKPRQIHLLKEVLAYSENFTLDSVPIELSPGVYHFLSEKLGIQDLYYEEKQLTNQKALELEPFLSSLLEKSCNPIYTGIKLSIIGNILDYTVEGVQEINLKQFILDYLEQPLVFDDSEKFKKELDNSKTLLYFTDNSGEVIFDRVFLNYIKKKHPELKIIIAAKEKPILNDMTARELIDLDFNQVGEVISSGSILPGNMEKYFSRGFRNIFEASDLIIAKGQGNFEGLSDSRKKIYFALMAKCPCIAKNLKVADKSLIFKTNI